MAASVPDKNIKKKTEKKLAAREEAKLLASFMAVMNNMRKQVSGGGREGGGEVGELWASVKKSWRILSPCGVQQKPDAGVGTMGRIPCSKPRDQSYGSFKSLAHCLPSGECP